MRNAWTRLLPLLLAAAMLAGCERKPDASAVSGGGQEPVTIKVGIWPSESDRSATEVWQNYQRIFAEQYPYITLEPQAFSYSFDTFMPMAASGTVPTIFQTYFTEPQRLIANRFVADITDYAREYGLLDGQREDVLSIAARGGRQYGIARDAYALALYMNLNLFRQAGLLDAAGRPLYPKTFDELITTAKAIKDRTGKAGFFIPTRDGVGGWHFCNIAWAFGAELQAQDARGRWQSGIGSAQTAQALQFVKDLKWKHQVLLDSDYLGWGDWIHNFATDEVGMVFAAPDAIRNVVIDYGMSKDALAAAPIPKGPGGQYLLMGGTFYMFAANAAPGQLDACFKLLEVMGMTPDASPSMLYAVRQELNSQVSQKLPVGPRTLNVWTDPERIAKEQELYDAYTNVDMGLFKEYYALQDSLLKVEYPQYCQEMYRLLDNCIRTVLADGDSDPAAVLSEASREFQDFYLSDTY